MSAHCLSVVIVGIIRRKPVLTHASIVCGGMNSVNIYELQFGFKRSLCFPQVVLTLITLIEFSHREAVLFLLQVPVFCRMQKVVEWYYMENQVQNVPQITPYHFSTFRRAANFNRFRVLAALLHGTVVVGVSRR